MNNAHFLRCNHLYFQNICITSTARLVTTFHCNHALVRLTSIVVTLTSVNSVLSVLISVGRLHLRQDLLPGGVEDERTRNYLGFFPHHFQSLHLKYSSP